MTHKKVTEVRSCYHIQDIIDASENVHIEYILFCYVLTGCDTISAIHMFGKISILAKLEGWSKLRNIADQFYLEVMSVDRASSITKGHAYDFSEKQQKKGKKGQSI